MNTVKWSAIGIGTKNQEGNWLEIFYPKDLINLDSNIIECKKFINDKILKNILHLTKSSKHPKSFLQEYSIKYFNTMPKYNLVKKIGPDHSPNFIVNVSINDKFQTLAEGRNIQLAEENAAKKLISIIETNKHK